MGLTIEGIDRQAMVGLFQKIHQDVARQLNKTENNPQDGGFRRTKPP
jgi:hypothetical protein